MTAAIIRSIRVLALTEMAPAPRVLYLGPKGKRSIEPCGMCQVWMPSNPTNIARKRVQEIVEIS